jgi:hypothetical protein
VALVVLFFFLLCLAAVIALVGYEMKTSRLQSQEISRYAAKLTYQLEPGPSKQIAFPDDGPFDKRLGYVLMPMIQERLVQRGYQVSEQVRFSDALYNYASHGFFVPYTEKVQAGLTLMTAVPSLSTSTSIRLITILISMPYRPWSSSLCCLSRTVNS